MGTWHLKFKAKLYLARIFNMLRLELHKGFLFRQFLASL